MGHDVVEHLEARFVFVVGKGGVGKTTSAGAIALALAEGGERTHLLSTDPAHSLGDLFGRDLPEGETVTGICSPALSAEELDAPGRGRRWFAEVGEAVADLVDRGTYLDREDVAVLLDRSLPGMDEVMAALRVAELATPEGPARVVVDTAPTGHTLRLLDCGSALRGWSGALAAMAAKAGAVATGLTGRRPRFAGEEAMERLGRDVTHFEEVLGEADFVVVTREGEGEAVDAETGRLAGALRDRGLRVAAVVRIGRSGGGTAVFDAPGLDTPVVDVPLLDDPTGCDGLRRWGAPARSVATPDPAAEPSGPSDAPEVLPRRELLLFAGKGGTGKSTCAAACALALARENSVLLVSLDPAGSLGEVLGRPVDAAGTRFGPRLLARQLDAEERFQRFRKRYHQRIRQVFHRLGLDDSAPLDRRVLESILDLAPPGMDEIFALDAILEGRGEHDVLVLDTAPTGHFLRLLAMPETVLSWTRAVLRILLRYRAVLGLDDLAEDLLGLAKRLRSLIELLRDPERTGIVVVTLAGTLPRRETRRLLADLHARRTPVAALIRNRWTRAAAGEAEAPDTILAPLLPAPPVGPEGLLDFARRWARP